MPTCPHRTPTLTPTALTEPGIRGVVRVLGGAGTGKSSLLIETAAAHIAAGVDPESVLLLTGSARLGAQARAAITTALLRAGGRAVIREPLVRTVHSYAFAVLRLAAQRNGDPPPRLITSAEQDGIIRELLAGDLEDGDAPPSHGRAQLRPALSTVGFATELRDLLARCTERGVDPVALQRIGRLSGRPEWLAAGQFAQAYEQIMLLRSAVGMAAPQATVPALGAAELVGAALEAFADGRRSAGRRTGPHQAAPGRRRPASRSAGRPAGAGAAAGAELTVIAGDPNQSVFGYRGADPALLRGDEPAITLTRVAPLRARDRARHHRRRVAAARRDEARELIGAGDEPGLAGRADRRVAARRIRADRRCAAARASGRRRAVVADGGDRALGAAAGRRAARARWPPQACPCAPPTPTAPLADQPAVQALLTVLAATADGLDGDRALSLLTGPIGRVDPVSLRQLRRALRRADRQPAAARVRRAARRCAGDGEPARELSAESARPLRRVRAVLAAARRSAADGRDPRYTLWQAWQRSGLQRRWLAASERGGSRGAQADRDLDAVTALFDVAEQYVNRTAGASLRGLVDHVSALGLPGTPRERRAPSPTRSRWSARTRRSAANGNVVVIAGLQEGLWPNTTPRGGVLGTQQLVDVLDGVADAAPPACPPGRRCSPRNAGCSSRPWAAPAADCW